MSPSAQHISATAVAEESPAETFFRILFHDDRRSTYFVSSDAGGTWTDSPVRATNLSALRFGGTANYYITHNGFTGKRRTSNRTRQINALFFDIDCHKADAASRDNAVADALHRLTQSVEMGVLPRPSLMVHSGRGLHLYYVLNRSLPYRFNGSGDVNEKGLALFTRVQNQLAGIMDEALAGVAGVDVDRAVFDHTRVARIPGTYNAKAGTYAQLLDAHSAYFSLADLSGYKPLFAHGAPARKIGHPATILQFQPMMMSRLNKVAELQEYRKFDCEGSRELMGFVYYNTAVQVYSRSDARQRLAAFNTRFNNPLPAGEINRIIDSVDTVRNVKGETGYYLLKASTLVKLLNMSEEEMTATNFFASKRMIERLEAKRRTQEKRDSRSSRIIALCKEGVLTRKEIAAEVGCSVRTVVSTLKTAGLTRDYSVTEAVYRCNRKHAEFTRSPLSPQVHSLLQADSLFSAIKSAKNWPTSFCSERSTHSFIDFDGLCLNNPMIRGLYFDVKPPYRDLLHKAIPFPWLRRFGPAS